MFETNLKLVKNNFAKVQASLIKLTTIDGNFDFLAYAKLAAEYVAKKYNYDVESSNIVKQLIKNGSDKKTISETYKQLLNLDNTLLNGKGVCKQFAQIYLLALSKGLGNRQIDNANFNIGLINGNWLDVNGIDNHTINFVEFKGNRYYVDVATAINFKAYPLLMAKFNMVNGNEYLANLKQIKNASFVSTEKVMFTNKNFDALYNNFNSNLYMGDHPDLGYWAKPK